MKKYPLIMVMALTLLCPLPEAVAQGGGKTSVTDSTSLAAMPKATDGDAYVSIKVPVYSGFFQDTPVAVVDDVPITLADLTRQLVVMKTELAPGAVPDKIDYAAVLDRLITTRLVLLEADNVGLQERYGIKDQIEEFELKTLLIDLLAWHNKDLKPDPAELDKLYRKMSRSVKLESFFFQDDAGAKAFSKELKEGRSFTEVIASFETEGKVRREESDFIKLKDLGPNIAQEVFELKVGEPTQIFQDEKGLAVLRVADSRFEEDAAVESQARSMVLAQAHKEAGVAYADELERKFARVDHRLLDKLDFKNEATGLFGLGESKPVDIQAMKDDKRVIASFVDASITPITVGDLTQELEGKMYHGTANASSSEKLAERKMVTFKNMVFKKVGRIEAVRQGLDKTPDYHAKINDFKTSLLFGAFVNKIVVPEVTISEEEVKQYFQAHINDYSSPVMLQARGLAFATIKEAEAAGAKLRKGSDFKWVSANSAGLVDQDKPGVLVFDGRLLTVGGLPEEFQSALANPKAGDIVVQAGPGGIVYVLLLERVVPATPQPYEEAREAVAKRVFNEKLKKAMDGWVVKLKEAYKTKIYLTGS